MEHDLLYFEFQSSAGVLGGVSSETPGEPEIGANFLNPSRINADIALGRRRVSLLFLLALASALVLVGIGSTPAADSTPSQCVACHTDAAKLKPLTPPDPPSAEEGEG